MKSKLSSTFGTFEEAILAIIQMNSFSLYKISRYAFNMLTLRTSLSVPTALAWRVPRKISRTMSISHTGIMDVSILKGIQNLIKCIHHYSKYRTFLFLKKAK